MSFQPKLLALQRVVFHVGSRDTLAQLRRGSVNRQQHVWSHPWSAVQIALTWSRSGLGVTAELSTISGNRAASGVTLADAQTGIEPGDPALSPGASGRPKPLM